MLAACYWNILHLYDRDHFKHLYINPTTEAGYRIVRKLGFKSLETSGITSQKSPMYVMDMTDAAWHKIADFYERFRSLAYYAPMLFSTK